MTDKLVWRLSKLPTPPELQGLVNDKIITQEEAREILFETQTEETIEVEELKSEIKFLRKVIDSLSGDKKEVIEKHIHHHKDNSWYHPYWTYCTTDVSSGTTTGTGVISAALTGSATDLSCSGTSDQVLTLSGTSNRLSDIKTF